MSEEAYKVWTLIFNGLTAIGTVGAVIMALFLSRKKDEPRISVSAGIYSYVDGMGSGAQRGVLIRAQNIGVRAERVQYYGYTIGYVKVCGMTVFRGATCIVPNPINYGVQGEIGFPSDIDPGKMATSFMPYDEFNRLQLSFFTEYIDGLWLPGFIKRSKWLKVVVIATAKCWVVTSRDKTIPARLELSLRQYILDQYEARNSDQPHTEEENPKT